MTRRHLRAIDLCSGPGGVTTGYKAAGLQILAAVDTDPASRDTYAANHPEVRLYADDLLKLQPRQLLSDLNLRPGSLDVLTACVPCQTFSSLARKVRPNDPRNLLVLRVADFVKELQPRALVMENVPSLREDRRFVLLLGRLRRLGYGVWSGVIDAANYGVPQRRRRLVLIAMRGVSDSDAPRLTHEDPDLRSLTQRRTVRDVFRSLRRHHADDALAKPKRDFTSLIARRIAAIPKNGGSRGSLDRELALRCHTRLGSAGAGSSYGRMRYDDVAPTLTTRCTTPACGRFLHPRANRAISLREAASIQTFPPRYIFKGGTMAIQAQIGNAVPPRLARAIAVVVTQALRPVNRLSA